MRSLRSPGQHRHVIPRPPWAGDSGGQTYHPRNILLIKVHLAARARVELSINFFFLKRGNYDRGYLRGTSERTNNDEIAN